ncbi:phage tail tube protein [Pyruvatibacter sp.]
MAEHRIAGQITIFAAGKQLKASGAFSYSVQPTKRETKTGTTGVDGFSDMPTPAFIEGPVRLKGEVTTTSLSAIDNATVQLDLANGVSVVLEEAWVVGDVNGDTSEAQATVRFEAATGREINVG